MTDRELMQMALDTLEDIGGEWGFTSQRTLPKRMNVIEALRAALAQPEQKHSEAWWRHEVSNAFANGYEKGRASALKQPEQEPVATVYDAYDTTGIDWHCKDAPATGTKLYTAQPQREFIGLTDKEIENLWNQYESRFDYYSFSCAIEAKLKEKNT